MRISDTLIRLIGARDPHPNDADVLAYTEGRLSQRNRASFERHFTQCDDCRHVLAFLGREADEAPVPMTEDAVTAQTNRVLAYINNDERNQNKSAQKARAAGGFYVSYPKLASVGLTVVAIAIAVFFIPWGPRPAEAGMEALKLAVKDERRTEARVSGGLDHSRYAAIRGGESNGESNNDTVLFDRAESMVKAAREEAGSVDEKLVLARICLERGTSEKANLALEILNQLATRGVETPEVLNDTGVAQYEMGNFDDAISSFTKALAKKPGYYEALFNRALAEERVRRNDDAKRDWQQFIEISLEDNWKTEARKNLSSLATSDR